MTEPATLTVGPTDSGFVVYLDGRGTMHEGPAFCRFVQQTLDAADEPTLVLCIDGCQYMDSTFLGGLIALHKRYSVGSDRRFVVAASEDARQRLLKSARLDLILHLIDHEPACAGNRAVLPTPPADPRDFTRHAIECHRLLADIGGPQAAVFQLVAEQLTKELNATDDDV